MTTSIDCSVLFATPKGDWTVKYSEPHGKVALFKGTSLMWLTSSFEKMKEQFVNEVPTDEIDSVVWENAHD